MSTDKEYDNWLIALNDRNADTFVEKNNLRKMLHSVFFKTFQYKQYEMQILYTSFLIFLVTRSIVFTMLGLRNAVLSGKLLSVGI